MTPLQPPPHHAGMTRFFFHDGHFALAWLLPLAVAAGLAVSPLVALAVMLGMQVLLALAERLPALAHSPPAAPSTAWHRLVPRLHVALQAGLLGWALYTLHQLPQAFAGAVSVPGWAAVVAAGVAVGGVAGSQGITIAHELGHSRSRLDRSLAWLLMGSVLYAHFMVEHYRGHHVRAATFDDPASARRGESLWRFLPRTLLGSWRSAWQLEAQRLMQHRLRWQHSTLLWATVAQAAGLLLLFAALGAWALLFWLVQAAYAVFLLEAINYIEHYGLQRRLQGSRPEPFGMAHAWNADSALTNAFVINLQRHSDHHMHAWKPYAELQPLPGPQLPTGYAGCLFLASVPPLWFAVMEPRLKAMEPRVKTAA